MTEIQKVDSDDVIIYQTDVIINGTMYFQSLAHQLAKHICCRKYEEFRLTCTFGFMDATIYMEQIIRPESPFGSALYGKKKCIGVLFFDPETYKITLQKLKNLLHRKSNQQDRNSLKLHQKKNP